MLVSFLNSLPPSLRIKCCSPPPSSSDDPAWFLSTYLLGDAVFLHPEFSPTYWSWDNPVFVHQLVLRWPFPSILRWPCFPPRGPENDLVSIHPEMALFSATRSWDDPVSLHPEMTLLSPPPGPETAMTLFSSTLALLFWLIWYCPEPLGFFNSLLELVCCPVFVSPGLKYCPPCPIGSTVLSSLTNTVTAVTLLMYTEMKTPPHSLTEFGYSVAVNQCQMHESWKGIQNFIFSCFHHRELTLLPTLTQCEVWTKYCQKRRCVSHEAFSYWVFYWLAFQLVFSKACQPGM